MSLSIEYPRSYVRPLPTSALGTAGRIDLSRPAIAAVLALSIVCCGLTAARIVHVERDLKPVLARRAQLVSRMEASQRLLRDARLGATDLRIARADSVASTYHAIAAQAPLDSELRIRLEGYTAAFTQYYVQARRAAAGYSMSADADGSSAEDARLGYTMLHENIVAGMAADSRALVSARASTAPVELAAWFTVLLTSAGILLRRDAPVRMRRVTVASASDSTDGDAPEGEEVPEIRLEDAVARMARKRLAASIAAARLAQRNNERQIEISRTWHEPTISLVPPTKPTVEMDVYEDDALEQPESFGTLTLMKV
ncbi:MAG: hypothetical protein ABIV10_02005 [Gemmatimonadaceae bacterium]